MNTLHHDNTSLRELDAFLKELHECPVTFFPIRHHSPACSWHLQNLIRKQKPHLIMIEGPQDFNDQIPHLLAPEMKTPVAIYTTYVDKARKIIKRPQFVQSAFGRAER